LLEVEVKVEVKAEVKVKDGARFFKKILP